MSNAEAEMSVGSQNTKPTRSILSCSSSPKGKRRVTNGFAKLTDREQIPLSGQLLRRVTKKVGRR